MIVFMAMPFLTGLMNIAVAAADRHALPNGPPSRS